MKTKPKKLDVLAAFLVALAPSLPIQIMILYGNTPFETEQIAAKLTPLNWAIFFLSPVAGFLVYRASIWSLLALPALAAVVGYNNWFVSRLGMDYSPWMTDLGTLAFMGMCGMLLTRDVLAVLLHPKRRWWLTPVRKQAEVKVRMQIHNKQFRSGANDEFYTTTFDISEGGAFIPFGAVGHVVKDLKAVASGARQGLLGAAQAQAQAQTRGTKLDTEHVKPGTQCYVCINVKETDIIQCRAEIVRVAESHGRYPAGMGIRFLGLSWEERRALSNFLKVLPDKAVQTPTAAAA